MPTIRRCCIVGCMSNSRQNPQLQFFQFPKPDNPFYKLWTQACHASLSRILPFKKPVVCAMHFHPHCIGGRRLTGSAVPTLKLEVPSNLKAVEQQAMVEEIERSRKCAYINAVVYEWLVRANLDPQLRGSITHGMIKEKAETAKQIIGCDSFMADNRWLNRFRESHLTGFAQKLASNQLKPMGPSLWIPDIVQDLQNLFPPTSAERIESFENMPEQYMNYMKQYGEYDEEEEVGSEQSYGDHDQNYQQQQQQQQHQPHPHQQQHHTAHNYYNQHSGYDAYVQQQQQQHHQLAHHQAAGYNAYHDYYSQHHQQQQQQHQHQQHQHHQQHPPLHYPHHPGYGYHQHHSQQSPSRPMSRSPTQQATVSQHTAAGMAMSTSPSHSTSQRTSPYPASNSSNSNPAKRARSNEPETNEQSNGAIRTAFDSTNNAVEPMVEDLTESPDANNDNSNTRSHNDNASNIKNNGTSSSSNDSGNHSNDNNNDERRNSFKIKLPLTQAVSNTGSPTRTPPPLQSSSSSKSAAAPTNGTSSGSTSPKSLNGIPPTQTNGHSSLSPTPSTVTQIKEIETYTQALEYLKPLEDFALFKENFRAIGLISQLEMILRKGERSIMPSLTD